MVKRWTWKLLQLSVLFFAATITVKAQEVRWSPASGTLGDGQTEELQLVFEQCSPEGEVKIPEVSGLEFGRPSQSRQVSVVNFKVSQNVTYTYPVRAKNKGKIEIPAFDVLTNKGAIRVEAAQFEAGDAKVAGGKASDVVHSHLRFTPSTFWEGQVLDLEYGVFVSARFNGELASGVEWRPPGMTLEDWGEGKQVQMQFGGAPFAGIIYKTRGCLVDSRSKALPEVQQKLRVHSGSRGFGFIFNQNTEEIVVKTPPTTFEVKPLPLPAPAEFSNAVGQFRLKSNVVPLEVQLGEPVTWTLELQGTGNWPAGISLPAREVARSFRVIQPKSKQALAEKKKFEGTLTEDLVLIPSEAGSYSLGPVKFVYFDPVSGTYQTIQSEPVEIKVRAKANAVGSSANSPLPPNSANASASSGSLESPSFDAKPVLPRDPMLGQAHGWRPHAALAWSGFIGTLLFLWGAWMRFSWKHVPQTDPLRYRREAREKILEVLSGELNRDLIREWQKGVRAFLRPETPVLGATEVAQLFEAAGFDPAPWQSLWEEADRILYGPEKNILEDWLNRATEAANALVIPKPNQWTLFLPRNLFPIFCFLSLITWGQADPITSYQQGDFEGARVVWTKQAEEFPLDWKVRANLSLTLAQLGKWQEAQGHAASAFLQHPREEALRWNLLRMAERAKGMDPDLGAVLERGKWLLFSPAEWQVILTLALLLSGASLFLALRVRYGKSELIPKILQSGILGVGILLVLISVMMLWQYGSLASAGAALVIEETEIRSVPTEVEKAAIEKKLPVGKVVVIDGSFLGWRKVQLENRESGWVRKEAIVPLY